MRLITKLNCLVQILFNVYNRFKFKSTADSYKIHFCLIILKTNSPTF